MYAKRVQIHNYGPIDHIDIAFPFDGDIPKPVLLVGENGSGKSILLSHIVNVLLAAQQVAYPETPEVETGKVYKLRSSAYIKSGSEYYFGRVDFEDDLFRGEIRSRRKKQEYAATPAELQEGDVIDAWNGMNNDQIEHLTSNISGNKNKIQDIFQKNCVLYFPPNRFEEPAWLNEENLNAKAQYVDLRRLQGYTNRRVINYSPLNDNQNWLFELIYDMTAFEIQTRNILNPAADGGALVIREILEYSGNATTAYETALQIVRRITAKQDAEIVIGRRHSRVVSVKSETGRVAPNIFQLSSGETTLLNLFLSILRDFDSSGTPFSSTSDIRGIVVIDEIELHLHANHQHEILPALTRMFPRVQFVVATHSPLFILGMHKVFGEDGFAVYRLPEGQLISPEEFNEFGDAYQAFTETARHSREIQAAVENAQRPIAFMEGVTDIKYIQRASELLGKAAILEKIEVRDGGGAGKLSKVWKNFGPPLTDAMPQKMLLIFDCDTQRENTNRGKLFQRTIPLQCDSLVDKGIENLFSMDTLRKALDFHSSFIDFDPERMGTVRGAAVRIPEKWTVNEHEKMNLCNWLCENGTAEDFQGFEVVFELLEEVIEEEIVQVEASTETEN